MGGEKPGVRIESPSRGMRTKISARTMLVAAVLAGVAVGVAILMLLLWKGEPPPSGPSPVSRESAADPEVVSADIEGRAERVETAPPRELPNAALPSFRLQGHVRDPDGYSVALCSAYGDLG